MSEQREPFLERWSRLKTKDREAVKEAQEQPPAPASPPAKVEEPPQPLPKIEDLTPDSDFRPFMNASVDPTVRRDALKKLFADPHFNVPDPFEAYSGDYTVEDPISPEFLKTLNQAKKLIFDEPEKVAGPPEPEKPEATVADAEDGAGSKDA